MSYQTVTLASREHIATLTLNRPEAHNAMSAAMNREIRSAIEEARDDEDVRVLIITGAGDKAFCAGRDLKEYSQSRATPVEVWAARAGQSGISAVAGMTKPVIAAINGFAIGGGLELALAADIRIASERSTFAFFEIRRGFFPGGGATWRLPPLVGQGWAMEMVLGGEPIDAATAERIGLVNRVVPHADLLAAANTLATKISGWSPASVMLAKQAILQSMAVHETTGANISGALRALAETNPDRIEATRAFLDKSTR